MKRSFVLLATGAMLLAAVSTSWGRRDAAQPALLRLPPAAKAGETVLYGHIKSLARRGGRYELRFDPAWWLTGATASRAALEDTGSSDVPNDYYLVDEGHRLLTYVVPATARATVITVGPGRATVRVAELAQIAKGRNPRQRRLLEPGAGYWIRVGSKYPSPVLSLDQQYQP